jgi:hypothetical protein
MQYVWSLISLVSSVFSFSAIYQWIRLTFLFILSQNYFILNVLKCNFRPIISEIVLLTNRSNFLNKFKNVVRLILDRSVRGGPLEKSDRGGGAKIKIARGKQKEKNSCTKKVWKKNSCKGLYLKTQAKN